MHINFNFFFIWDPTTSPTISPTLGPTHPTISPSLGPTQPTISPSLGPTQPTVSPTTVQVFHYEGCYSGTTWEGQRQADVSADLVGVLDCRDACVGAGYRYFGTECPRGSPGAYVMHCECGNTLVSEALASDIECQQLTSPTSPCTGSPDYTVYDVLMGSYVLGAHSFNSAYQTRPRNNILLLQFFKITFTNQVSCFQRKKEFPQWYPREIFGTHKILERNLRVENPEKLVSI